MRRRRSGLQVELARQDLGDDVGRRREHIGIGGMLARGFGHPV
jgi:hypothetical protein